MLNSTFIRNDGKELNLLCLGAHCDDIEIGCGGSLLKWIEAGNVDQVRWIVFASTEIRKKEAVQSASRFLKTIDQKSSTTIYDFDDGYLPANWSKVKDEFEKVKQNYEPDIIFTHYRNDLHQDHRLVNELTWNTFRNHIILEYEIPKYDGDLGNPNIYIPINEDNIRQKKHIIFDSFKSQMKKHWLDESLLNGIARIRGMECVSDSGYAEAFYCRKMLI